MNALMIVLFAILITLVIANNVLIAVLFSRIRKVDQALWERLGRSPFNYSIFALLDAMKFIWTDEGRDFDDGSNYGTILSIRVIQGFALLTLCVLGLLVTLHLRSMP